MKELKKLYKKNQGFTLVELMIVVAIIGILAAIAIPQFAAYRIRGYNSSAISDVRNLNTSQAALFADWQRYGITQATAGAVFNVVAPGGAAGAFVIGGDANGDGLATLDTVNTPRGIQIAVGNGVSTGASTDVAVAAATPTTAFSAVAKHLQGNTVYGVDSDTVNVYQNPGLLAPGAGLNAFPGTIGVTVDVDDFQAAADTAAGWSIK